MKNETLARAITDIDSSLIDEAYLPVSRRPKAFILAGALAASLVLVFCTLMLVLSSNTQIKVYDKALGDLPVEILDRYGSARSASMLPDTGLFVPLEITVHENTQISVTGGDMQVCDIKTKEPVYSGQKFVTEKSVIINWTADTDNVQDSLSMIVCSDKASYELVLSFDTQNQYWTICKNNIT